MAESRRRRSLNASAAIRLFVLFVATLLGTATPVAAASPSPGASPSLSPTPPPLQPVNVPINAGAIVGLTASGSQGDHSWSAEGWGLVVDSSGLILANASVVAPDAPGTAAGYADPSVAATVSEVDIWTSPGPGQPMEPTWTGKVVAVDGFLDIAIVAPELTISGEPVALGSVNLPFVPLSTAAAAVGNALVVVDIENGPSPVPVSLQAFAAHTTAVHRPQPGSCCPQVVSDFLMPDAWPGGVLLVDASGALVAYPAFLLGYPPRFANGTPADAIAPVLAAAIGSTAYSSTFGTPGSGNETLKFRSWSTSQTPCTAADSARVTSYPPNTTHIAAGFDTSNFTPNEDVMRIWALPDKQLLLVSTLEKWTDAGSGCHAFAIHVDSGTMANGTYELDVFAGGNLRQVASQRVKVGAPAGSIVLTGHIIDADTQEPISDASFFVLAAGTDLSAWASNPSFDQVAAFAITDVDGAFTTDPPIPQGTYPFLVEADGYQLVGGTLRTGTNGVIGILALAPLR